MINGKYKSVFIIPFVISVILKITTKQYEMIHEYLFFILYRYGYCIPVGYYLV